MKVRRLLVPVVLGVLLAGGGLAAPPRDGSLSARSSAAACGPGDQYALVLAGACAHEDEPPPGVDPTVPVSTTELREREGAGPTAYAVAQDLGVPAPAQAAATSPLVDCDGDGTSGYRIQAMYVVEAGSTNRFASMQSTFQLWAAGVDDVVNRSAALTGGVRHLRYVTEAGSGGCVAKVLNVTVPSGSLASFNATISAVQALGYTDPTRKYLMWTDATSLCGIASLYPGDGAGQDNPNNGYYAQYARIDSGCWGFGDGSTQHSVEAHELMHMLGGVQNTAPHSTHAGHCWDESDTMCYADGGNHAMVQICTPEHEYFYDCNSDDYYSTFPDPGSYLDGHWDAADSRFLIGGGDGTGGGTAGAPTVLGATISVNNPAVPGLSTQASVAPSLPTGRTVTTVQWKSARADCVFSAPTALQTDVTCNATTTAATTVTATLTDSTGATKIVTSPLTFATGTVRPVTLALGAAGQQPADGGNASVCTGAPFALRATAIDTASGDPIKGLTTAFTKQLATALTPSAAGSAATNVEGASTSTQTASATTTYRTTSAAGTVYAAGAPATVVAVPTTCSTALTAGIDKTATYYADPVTVSGHLTASASGTAVAASGVKLAVKLTPASGTALTLGTATTTADGSYTILTKPTLSGTISVSLAATAGYAAATATAGAVTVTLPDTAITGAVDQTDVGYGSTITVTGTLQRVAGATTTPLGGKAVGIYVRQASGTTLKIGGVTTTATGTYTAKIALKATGTLSVAFAGVTGQPAASVEVTTVTAGTWTTALTASSSASTVIVGGSAILSGTVTKTYAGTTLPAGTVRVSLYFTATGGTPVLVSSVLSASTGTWSARVYPKASGTWTARVLDVAGYAGSSATPLSISLP
ncbi:hypothetical protein [Nocardioides ultimimeridianus]